MPPVRIIRTSRKWQLVTYIRRPVGCELDRCVIGVYPSREHAGIGMLIFNHWIGKGFDVRSIPRKSR